LQRNHSEVFAGCIRESTEFPHRTHTGAWSVRRIKRLWLSQQTGAYHVHSSIVGLSAEWAIVASAPYFYEQRSACLFDSRV
jgi:hypothetical protein